MTTETAINSGLTASTRAVLWGGIVVLLVLPAIAMPMTTQVNWGVEDFFAAAILLGGAGLAMEVLAKVFADSAKQKLAALVIVAVLLLAWVELAVGIFD